MEDDRTTDAEYFFFINPIHDPLCHSRYNNSSLLKMIRATRRRTIRLQDHRIDQHIWMANFALDSSECCLYVKFDLIDVSLYFLF